MIIINYSRKGKETIIKVNIKEKLQELTTLGFFENLKVVEEQEEHDVFDHYLAPRPDVFKGCPYTPPTPIGEVYASIAQMVRTSSSTLRPEANVREFAKLTAECFRCEMPNDYFNYYLECHRWWHSK